MDKATIAVLAFGIFCVAMFVVIPCAVMIRWWRFDYYFYSPVIRWRNSRVWRRHKKRKKA